MATTTTPIETKRVRGRRKLRFATFDEVLADAERLNTTGYRQLGNWSLGMMMKHLGNGMHASVMGGTFRVKWYLRLLGPYVIKPRLIRGPFPPGFILPRSAAARLIPNATSYEEGVEMFRSGVARLANETNRDAHPVIGPLTVEEWNQFHLRHAEMHLSFLVPE